MLPERRLLLGGGEGERGGQRKHLELFSKPGWDCLGDPGYKMKVPVFR